jgi:arylformamidase
MTRLIDISPPIRPDLAVWPGDVPPQRIVQQSHAAGDDSELSALHATVHLGAHLDAPIHIRPGGATIDQLPLDLFVGPCTVIRVSVPPGGLVAPEQLPASLPTPRVLIATDSYPDPTRFNDDFAGLSVAACDRLADAGVKLVGVDTPSVDRFADADLPAHRRLIDRGVTILEGLVLRHVTPGPYDLIALPLRLTAFDAAPTHAILRTL